MLQTLRALVVLLAAAATFSCNDPNTNHEPVGLAFGIPTECDQASPNFGPIEVGTRVYLGRHSTSGIVSTEWWNSDMDRYVGSETVVTQLAGVDIDGCPYVRVAIDGGSWGWRIRDMALVGEKEVPYPNPQNFE